MSKLAASLFLIFLLKSTCVGLLAVCLRKKFSSYLESLLASWCGVQTIIYGQLLILSAFSILTETSIWIITVATLITIAAVTSYRHSEQSYSVFKRNEYLVFSTKPTLIPLLGIIIVFIYLCWHSFCFYDTTLDAFSYGLTRIQFYAHYRSLFVNQPTISFNIFSNEWNGELSALYYVLAARDLQAATFFNAETWLLLSLTFCYLAEIFSVSARYRLLFGFTLASAPVFLGLAMMVKGDLLSITAFLLGIGFILRFFIRNDNPFLFLSAVTAFSISEGSKITLIISSGLFMALAFCQLAFSRQLSNRAKLVTALFALIFISIDNSRYLINFFVYHDFFKHVESTAGFKLTNLQLNLFNVVTSTADLLHTKLPFPKFFLAMSPGFMWLLPILVSSLMVISLFILRQKSFQPLHLRIFKKMSRRQQIFFAAAFLSGFIIFSAWGVWRPWSYRYYAGWVSFLVVIMIVVSSKYWRRINMNFFCGIWIFLAVWNYLSAFLPCGEESVVPYYVVMQKKSGLERMMINIPSYGRAVSNFANNVPSNANILILNGLGRIVSPFFGPNFRNNIFLMGTLDGPFYGWTQSSEMLLETIKNEPDKYDYIVLSGNWGMLHQPDQPVKTKLALYNYKEILVNRDVPDENFYLFQKIKTKEIS